ncbi:MAG: hypothetical protein L6R42_000195 [Xanthoria sp. 1 TBL-2021]|nr:MAG: hypothetical protein L6R42_000195 [Xanthoria sp. 1 TBL-2021]
MYLNKGGSNSLLGRLGYIFSLLLLIGILHQNVALGSPLTKREDNEPDDPNSDVDNPDGGGSLFSLFSPTEDKYPDLDKCREEVSVAKDKSVFYSQVGKHEDKPQKFADQLPDGVLLREAYPSGFADKNDQWSGYKKFLDRASQAFAEKSSGIVHVLLPTDNTDLGKKVWTKTEKPALTSSGSVTRIVKVDPDDFTKKCVLWGDADDNLVSCDAENGPVPGLPLFPSLPLSLFPTLPLSYSPSFSLFLYPTLSLSHSPPNPFPFPTLIPNPLTFYTGKGSGSTSSGSNYTPGWCGVHVTQYQKKNPSDPSSQYHLDVTLYDGAQKEISKVTKQDAPAGQGVDVTSALPWVLTVTAQNVDKDAVLFKYGDQSWGSNDQGHYCNFGSYDSRNRYVLILGYLVWL